MVFGSLSFGGSYSGNIALPSAGYAIQGTYNVLGGLTISTPCTFSNTHMAFGDNVSVNQNFITTIDRSYWHGCDKNWTGIKSNNQLTVNNSVIEDAATAINILATSSTPTFNLYVDNTIFNKNNLGIYLNGSYFKNVRITGSIFTSRDIPTANYVYTSGSRWTSLSTFNSTALSAYSIGYLKGSTALGLSSTQRGQTGISSISASAQTSTANPNGNIQIGDISSTPTINATYTNIFDYIRLGVFSAISKSVLYNNYFQNIAYVSSADGGTSSSCFYNSLNYSIVGSSINGSAGVPYANTFYNSLNGVYSTNNGTMSVNNNQFNGVTQYGVWIDNFKQSTANTSTLAVTNNTFTTCLYDLYASSNLTVNVNFSNNVATYPLQTSHPKVCYHAYVSEISNPSTAKYNISFNNAYGKIIGVYCLNTYGQSVSNNTITVRWPIGGGFNAPVWLDNSGNGFIQHNTLDCTPTNSGSYNTFGVFTNASANNTYCDNLITGAGSAMKFQGTCASNIYKNNLNSKPSDPCLFGIFLDNNGYVGPIKYSSACAENIFGDFNYSVSPSGDTYAQNASAGSTIDYPGTYTSSNQYCPFTNTNIPFPATGWATPFTLVSNSTINQAGCGSSGFMMAMSAQPSSSTNNLSAGIPVIMNNGLSFSANNSNALAIANKSVFELVRKSAINTNGITGASSFMNTNANNAIGKFYKMDSLVHLFAATGNTATLNQAKVMNAGLMPSGNLETNQKNFNTIYHAYMKDPVLVTTSQINTLKSIAALCPFTDGTSVYQARALVRRYDTTVFVNPCEYNAPISSNRFLSTNTEPNTTKETLATLVYPNPASTEITVTTNVDGAKLLIFNIMGQLLIENELNTLTKINVSELKNGTYIYKIVKDNKIIKVDKLIINK
ncbi:MAG: T9SS type A sorting domain-containing protein [Bacteroidetes bacterium]|nr:T9SS type A sorting domain-containing protein [Bacteroidota bacterium]